MKRTRKLLISFLLVIMLCTTTLQATIVDLKDLYKANIGTNINVALDKLVMEYGDILEIREIGKSAVGQIPIKAVKLGKAKRSIIVNGVHHARETMTGILTVNHIEDLAEAYRKNETRHGYLVKQLLDTVAIWFVPMLNPDGANLAMSTKPSWKANGRGVDLNRNYPTLYARTIPSRYPGSQGYAGAKPLSEPETQALYKLCEEMQFETAVAYHSAGRVIYWWYHQTGNLYTESIKEVRMLSNLTSYSIMPISSQRGGLGFTDWFIQKYKKTGYTIEIGKTVNGRPLAWSEYAAVWRQNKDVPLRLIISTLQRETRPWKTTINGKQVRGELIFDTGMVPLRQACDALGLTMGYDSNKKVTTVTKYNQRLEMVLGQKMALLNGEEVELTLPAYVKANITYISLRDLNTYFSQIVPVEKPAEKPAEKPVETPIEIPTEEEVIEKEEQTTENTEETSKTEAEIIDSDYLETTKENDDFVEM